MATSLIITTGKREYVLKWLESLRSKGEYLGDVLLLDYDGNLDDLRSEHTFIYSTKKVYKTFVCDRFRASVEALQDIYTYYDTLMFIDCNDIEFQHPIGPLLDQGSKELLATIITARPYASIVSSWWKTWYSIPEEYKVSLKDKYGYNLGVFLGPAKEVYTIAKIIANYTEADSRIGADELMFNCLIYYHNIPITTLSREWNCMSCQGEHLPEANIIHYAGVSDMGINKWTPDWEDGFFKIPRVVVCIATTDILSPRVKRCVERLRANTTVPFELVIVESHLKEEIFNHPRVMNYMFKGNFDYYVGCNDDLYVEPNWLDALIDVTRQDERIGIVGGLYFGPDGRIQHAGGALKYTLHNIVHLDSTHKYWFTPRDNIEAYRQSDCIFVTGALQLITAACFKAIGQLDENIGLAFADVEICLRAWEQGFRVVYTPKCMAMHEGSISVMKAGGWQKALQHTCTHMKPYTQEKLMNLQNRVDEYNNVSCFVPVLPEKYPETFISDKPVSNTNKVPIHKGNWLFK